MGIVTLDDARSLAAALVKAIDLAPGKAWRREMRCDSTSKPSIMTQWETKPTW